MSAARRPPQQPGSEPGQRGQVSLGAFRASKNRRCSTSYGMGDESDVRRRRQIQLGLDIGAMRAIRKKLRTIGMPPIVQ